MGQYAYDAGLSDFPLWESAIPRNLSLQVISRQYDGIIISSGSFQADYVEQFTKAGIPVVVFRRWQRQEYSGRVALLGTGLYQGARKAAEHLIACGCRHIVFADRISQNGHASKPDDLRLRGMVDALEAAGMSLPQESIISGRHSHEEMGRGGEAETEKWCKNRWNLWER